MFKSPTSTPDGSRRVSERQRDTQDMRGVGLPFGVQILARTGSSRHSPCLPAWGPWTKLLPAWLWLLRLLCGVFKDKWCRPGWVWSAGLPEPNAQSPRRARPTTFGLILVLLVFPRCFRQVLGRCEAFTRARQESTRQPACTRDGQLRCPRWTSRRATVGPASPSACVPRSGRLPNLRAVQPGRL